MGEKLRLDKLLAEMSVGTRSEVKADIRRGRVSVNGVIIKAPEYKVSEKDMITYDGKPCKYQEYEYYLLNKPSGIISASKDKKEKTVIDLIDSNRKDLFPVGRLDKDTEGLLLITNDGALAHNLLSPKKHVDKTYYVRLKRIITTEDEEMIVKGLKVDETFTALPAKLSVLNNDYLKNGYAEALITIQEGKFHQVKRMFQALGNEVVYLKRIAMGNLKLPENLEPGQYIMLESEVIKSIIL